MQGGARDWREEFEEVDTVAGASADGDVLLVSCIGSDISDVLGKWKYEVCVRRCRKNFEVSCACWYFWVDGLRFRLP